MTVAQQTWKELAALSGQSQGWNARRVNASSSAAIFFAIRSPENVPALLVEVSAISVPPIVEYPAAEGFQLQPEPMAPGPRGRVRLCLVLANEQYRDVFAVLVEDVIAGLCDQPQEEGVVRNLLARLHVWQVFMRRHGAGELGLEAQTGLAGELLFMRDRILGRIPARETIDAWVGPLGGPQDFILPAVALEIKASTMSMPQEVPISSLEQLDTERCAVPLLLCLLKVTAGVGAGGESLPQIVMGLRELLIRQDPVARGRFDERLLEVGYLDVHAHHYDQRLFRIHAVTPYRVAGAFPRIEVSDVREGILSCRYGIQLSSCSTFEIAEAELDNLIEGGRS